MEPKPRWLTNTTCDPARFNGTWPTSDFEAVLPEEASKLLQEEIVLLKRILDDVVLPRLAALEALHRRQCSGVGRHD